MSLNRENIETLKSVMLANAKRYDQTTFGSVDPDCGTRCCMAGFCRIIEVGEKQFNSEVLEANEKSRETNNTDQAFFTRCVTSGKNFLGIEAPEGELDDYTPDIFEFSSNWPDELSDEMTSAVTNEEKVLVAFKALDRMNDQGEFKESSEEYD